MQTFTCLVGNTLYVEKQSKQNQNIPFLIGVKKDKEESIIFLPKIASKDETRRIYNNLNNSKDIDESINLTPLIPYAQDYTTIIHIDLADWSIEGSATAAIQLTEPSIQKEVLIHEDIKVNLEKSEEFMLSGYLANHRGEGHLRVFTKHPIEEKTFKVNFDRNKTGGKRREDYQYFTVPINLNPGETKIRISVINATCPTPKAEDCFYFINDLKLKSKEAKTTSAREIARFEGKPESKDKLDLYKIHIEKFKGSSDSNLILEWSNGKTERSFSAIQDKSHFTQNFHHTVEIHFEKTNQIYCLYVGNRIAKTIRSSSQLQFEQIPPNFYNGEPEILSLTDASGSTILDQVQITPPRTLTPEDVIISEGKKSYPRDCTMREAHRLESIKKNLIEPADTDPLSLKNAIKNLELNYENLKLDRISFTNRQKIKVSVIIPAHNKVTTTYYCLCSLLLAKNNSHFEVIVVDDGSSDETTELEKIVEGITVLHNKVPLRFIGACNKGVAAAKGEYIVLLNNDTEVTSGWLDSLIEGFERFDNVGLVGSRLLYPDGRLQDAGGIIWGSGDPWNYGHGQNPWDPRFSYARQADYLSGAALMTTKKIWDEVGGLSEYLKPMYFEDTDFSFKVREAGYKTYFIPQSIIYHFEGVTSGTDTSQGFKKYQEVNRPKFKKRWAASFSSHGVAGKEPDLEKDRGIVGRILFIDYQLPRGDRDAGSHAALQEIKLVQSLGFKVTFLPANLADLGQFKSLLEKNGVEVITSPFYLSLPDFLSERGKEFDAVYVTRYNVLSKWIDNIKAFCSDAKIILCNADLHFLRELRSAVKSNSPELLEKSKQTQQDEMAIMRRADAVISYNEVEHSVIFSHSEGNIQPLKCPWVVDMPKRNLDTTAKRHGLSFLGSFKHPPNKEGIEWFVNDIMPFLDESVVLNIYGSGMTDEDKEDLNADNVNPIGFVEQIDDAFDTHQIFVAPLISGAGIKGKVLSAAAHGIPMVISPVAAEGTGLRHGQECMIADTVDEWKHAIDQLMASEGLRVKMATRALEFVGTNFSFESGREDMRTIFESVGIYSSLT
uniref:glycosyltransferase n=1 Tax=Synechococcus sp. UW106 TaxID=368495 RepID=UPI000E0F4A82|nr:glycosyltransferase [Synechococcus sp. UW106]